MQLTAKKQFLVCTNLKYYAEDDRYPNRILYRDAIHTDKHRPNFPEFYHNNRHSLPPQEEYIEILHRQIPEPMIYID